MKINVTDLHNYNGKTTVVRVKNREQHAKLEQFYPNMSDFKSSSNCYLVAKDNRGLGKFIVYNSSPMYNIINFEDIEFNQEVIGYKLLKDLPDVEKGTISIKIKNEEVYFQGISLHDGCDENIYPLSFVESKPDWFEPVYKPEEKIVSVGGKFDVNIKDNKIFHKKDDITDFVKELVEYYERTIFARYSIKIENIVFSETGCENQTTTINDWKQVLKHIS